MVLATLLFALVLLVGVRQGGFWATDALVAATGSIVLLVGAAISHPLDRRALSVVAALVVLALWWGVRAGAAGSVRAALPLGASCLACAAAFAVVRTLRGPLRQRAGLGIASLGAAAGLVGFTGLIWRWYPLAMPAQGLWRLSTTLTYSDAAGLALGMCLLVALGVDRHSLAVRLAVCICAGGLLASQSRGACVAVACAAAVVPWRSYVSFVVPLVAGAALGAVAVATSPDTGAVPWLGVVLVATLAVSAVPEGRLRSAARDPRVRMAASGCVLIGLLVSLLLLHHEIGLRALSPSDGDRATEWSVAWHQWGSAPIFGVGPDHLLSFHDAVGTYARFVHNEYLQVAADAGAVGIGLLVAVVVAIFRAVRRIDALSSCACAALVCCAVGGAFDFDWHLSLVGFLAGCCAGLAARGEGVETADEVRPRGVEVP
ncbi:MAG TPA: O-antigen ligase family protein [Acidimicrobiales bacterium]|nr:O-antigen ligase family protein [Acidimicrobiales bacterium]